MQQNIILQNRKGNEMDYIAHYLSPLGGITIASDGQALTGLWFDGQKYFVDTLAKEREKTVKVEDVSLQDSKCPLYQTKRWLDLYFSGKNPDFTPPLHMKTTEFRKDVWEIMLAIPYGETMTYGEIAEKIAKQRGIARMSAQAVGGAVGHNSISLIIPCHRVVGTNGSLTGYAGGIEKKIQLLNLEKVDMTKFFIPKKGTEL